MRQVHIGSEVRTINACPTSFIVYDRAFGTDHSLSKDINEFVSEVKRGDYLGKVLPMEAIMRIEYAFEACAPNAALPDFDVWVDGLPAEALQQISGVISGGWFADLMNEINATFFRYEAEENVGAAESQDEA
jgi:hypothetical protein